MKASIRHAKIENSDGTMVFEQKDVVAPETWSDRSVNIVASKYFYGKQGTEERETSVYQVVERITKTIAEWGLQDGYFETEQAMYDFKSNLYDLLINQKASPNSPVWFSIGTDRKPQSSACFILDVEDNIESIIDWWSTETVIFNGGSGAGINVSKLRSSKEHLSSGGKSSGPVSFMRAADHVASVIKSGGRVRRSAKMHIMNMDHPDIEEFINCKVDSEKIMRVMKSSGLSDKIDDDHLGVPFQSSNHSVRITDEFINNVSYEREWNTKYVNEEGNYKAYSAKDLFRKITEAIWECGDPGIQFHDTINSWNTVRDTCEYHASNPCGEYNGVNNSACNLATLKLTAFYKDGVFNISDFRKAVDIMITAQDIVIDRSYYPTEKIKENAMKYRALGLGYADLGGLLMRMGIPYDSDKGRNIAASLASIMTAEAYLQSGLLADIKIEFSEDFNNFASMKRVLRKHRDCSLNLDKDSLGETAIKLWEEVCNRDKFRNSQVTLMAPTGTIGLQMDCDTLGIEPEFSLVKTKTMAGGGCMNMVNQAVEYSLINLGYTLNQLKELLSYLKENGTLEGSSIEEEHLPIFDCALPSKENGRCLTPEAHIKMVAAIQPFISGASSKTINVPNSITVEEIEKLIFMAWEMGVKGITFYRDGCKAYQPLSTMNKPNVEERNICPVRNKLPGDRDGVIHKFRVGEAKGYITCGMYPDGSLGEVFVNISKEGSTIAGLMDTIATLTSIALQYNVPLEALVKKFSYSRFEPAGFTDNEEIKSATSLVDYLFRYLGSRFTNNCEEAPVVETPKKRFSGPICTNCGSVMVYKSGSCYTCECGTSSGGCG